MILGLCVGMCSIEGLLVLKIVFYRATACNAMHGIAVAVLSVCPSDACIVTKLNDALQIF